LFPDPTVFDGSVKYIDESIEAYKSGNLIRDISDEIKKVQNADLIIFQFPMYWLSVPAILKGWIDKVFIGHVAFKFPTHVYDEGLFKVCFYCYKKCSIFYIV